MANNKTISDEELVAALLANGTIKKAAKAAGISERSLYDRMNDKDFIVLYRGAKGDLIREAVFNLNRKLQSAVDTIAEIMTDKNTNPAIRLQAAQTILNNASKFSQRLQTEETETEEKANEFSFI